MLGLLPHDPPAVAGLIVTVAGLVESSTVTFHGQALLALVVMLLMPVAPNTPLMLQPLNVWLEFVSVALPGGGAGLVPAVAVSVEPVQVTFWLLLLPLTNVALTLLLPLRPSPETTAVLLPPTVRTADPAADALSGTASAATIAPAIARNQYLRMDQSPSCVGSGVPGSSLRPAGRPRRVRPSTSTYRYR